VCVCACVFSAGCRVNGVDKSVLMDTSRSAGGLARVFTRLRRAPRRAVCDVRVANGVLVARSSSKQRSAERALGKLHDA